MNALGEFFNGPAAQRLGWAVLHSLWQGALVGGLFEAARFALRRHSANARYLAGCCALGALLLAPAATFFFETGATPAGTSVQPEARAPIVSAPLREPGPAAGVPHAWLRFAVEGLAPAAPWVGTIWCAGVIFFSLKLTRGWWEVGKMRSRQARPVDADWLDRLDQLRRRLGISRPVRLLQSGLVQVPTVIGWLRPVILLPASSLTGLTPAQLEAILAHELAHVRRFDYLVNAFQCAVETLLFYHPVAWWISRCVREERENCCDDLVVRVCGDRVCYARALAALAGLRADVPALAFAASGGSLLKRIQRLLGVAGEEGPATTRQFGGLAMLGTGLALIGLGIYLNTQPTTFVATTRIKVERNLPAQIQYNGGEASIQLYDPYFIQTEFAVIESQTLLRRAVETLGLAEKWGARDAGGQPLEISEAVELLKRQIELRPIRNTSLIEIRAFSPRADEAALMANQVADSYRDYRLEQNRDAALHDVNTLKDQMDRQEQRVAEARQVVDRLRRDLNISDTLEPGGANAPMSADTLRHLEQLRIEAEAQHVKQAKLMEQLTSLSREDLRRALPTAVPDAQLNSLLTELDLAEQNLLKEKHDLGENHVEYRKSKDLVDDLNRKVDSRMDGILIGLKAQRESLQSYQDSLGKQMEEAKQRDIDLAARSAPYFEAKRKLEELQRFQQLLQAKILSSNVAASLPGKTLIEIVDRAQPAFRPIAPNHPRAVALIALGALLDLAGFVLLKGPPRPPILLQPA